MGPRRVGKTVMVNHSISKLIASGVATTNILYVPLETPIYTGLSLEKIVTLFSKMHEHTRETPLYVFFDEIQYLKDWKIHLKSLVDSFPSYQFVATGSAAAALRLKSLESGAGKFTDFLLPPLTFHEYLTFTEQKDSLIEVTENEHGNSYSTNNIDKLNECFIDYLNFGGYPEAVFSETVKQDISRFMKSDIIDNVILRDLPNLYGINDIQELNKLFTVIAYNTGQEVSLEELSQGTGISKNTLKRYIEYLKAAFLIKIVFRINQSAKKFKRATHFKVYLTNPSMRAALFGPVNDNSEAIAALIESAVYSQWFHSNSINNLYYSRWKNDEVDIVYLTPNKQKPAWCVEVKWTDLPYNDNQNLKSLSTFLSVNNLNQAALVTTKTITGHKIIDGCSVYFSPSSLYAYTLGANIQGSKHHRKFIS